MEIPTQKLPIANRPLIQWQIEALKHGGMKNIYIMTGHLGSQVRAAVWCRVECPKIHLT